jgi:uncharacterized circularly permuted ATP-grasp superfamily protein/uncharacterized alpha-E superfamily protein
MSVQVAQATGGLLDAYRRHPARASWDELLDADGVRPHQAALAATIESMGTAGLLAARAETRTFVADEGVTYGSPDSPTSRRWAIDPLPVLVEAGEWTRLARGLAQRADLLDRVLADLYGDRLLLRRRVLPAAAVLGHPGFLRADGPVPGGRRRLLLVAADLGRDASGTWQVISDRTGDPAGAGFAMVTRRIVSRVMAGLHRSSDLARLRGFFQTVTAALMDAAPGSVETPRVVVLSPGAASDIGFDTSFLATMLGFDVVEADDLVTSRGRPWLRAGDRLEPVDVVLRRVEAAMSDPLEFRGNSEIGLPGLVEAARNGHVAIANPVGAGVLDNPALVAHLDAVAEAVLGEPLLLGSPATWWCGDPAGLSHVRAELDRLVLKPIDRNSGGMRYGWQLTAAEKDELTARITAEPWAWCGQEPLELSTAPVVTGTGLEPRRFVLRGFGVAHGTGFHVLPGGLGRVAGSTSEFSVAHRDGTLAKDVWVPSAALTDDLAPARPRLAVVAAAHPVRVTPRVARTLLAIGRHAERAESTARLLKVADDLAEDHSSRPGTPGAAAMATVNAAVARITGIDPRPGEAPVEYLTRVALDAAAPGGVHFNARVLVDRAQRVRDLMSVDTWSVLGRLERTLAAAPPPDQPLLPLLENVLESLLAWAGILAQSMVRDSSWAFLDAGGRLERAQHTVKLLTATADPAPAAAELTAEAVLRASESIITHRRRAAQGVGPARAGESALTLLLLEEANPRSVAHQLVALAADLRLVGDEPLAAEAERVRLRLETDADQAVALRLVTIAGDLRRLDGAIAQRHFTRQATRHTAETAWQLGGQR